MRVTDHVFGDVPVAGGKGDGFAAERLGEPQRVSNAVTLFLRQLQTAPPFDVKRHPRTMKPVRQALGVPNETGAAHVIADADEDAFTRGPRSLDGPRLHFREQLLIDPIRGAAQRELAQRGQVCRRKEMLEGAFGLSGNVDFALSQPLD